MRIDIEKFPALFHKGVIVPNGFDPQVKSILHDIVTLAQSNVYYLSKTIIGASEKSLIKLLPLAGEIKDVTRGLAYKIKEMDHTMLYSFTNMGDGKINILAQMHAVYNGQTHGALINAYYVSGSENLEFFVRDTTENDQLAGEIGKIAIALELFLSFAEIETKTIQPSRQIWDGPTCLYNNKTKVPITVVDSSWYTNLVVSGAFNVQGHFRLQAYGPEMKQRKLIWINDFQKTGYTRKAKKENQ